MKPALKPKAKKSPSASVGIVVTDMSLKPIAFDRGAASILEGECHEPHEADTQPCLPVAVQEAFQNRDPAELPTLKTHFTIGPTMYSCRAYLVEPRDGWLAQPVLAVVLQRDSGAEDAISAVAAEYGLTDRAQEVLRGIAMGLTTKELAARMNRSPNTIKMFLRQIMAKMGVTTRSGLVGKVLNHVE